MKSETVNSYKQYKLNELKQFRTLYKTIPFFLIVIALLFLSGCNKDNSKSNDTLSAPAIDSTMTQSKAEEDSVKQSEPVKELKFSTAEEALKYMNSSPHSADYKAGIFPIMAKENLNYLTKLLNSEYPRFIIVDKNTMNVVLFDKYGREEARYGMACAKNYGTKHKKADSRTPEGFFSVEGVYDSTDWLFTDDNGHTSQKKGQFGPRFIRLKIPVTSQIGIHGTCSPWSIGHRTSHGCIRITNENILQLVTKVEPGMPVIVSPGVKDEQINNSENVYISYVSIDPQGTPRRKYTQLPANPNADTNTTTTADSTAVIVNDVIESAVPDSI